MTEPRSVSTILGLPTGTLVTGPVVVETVFAWPGMGNALAYDPRRRVEA